MTAEKWVPRLPRMKITLTLLTSPSDEQGKPVKTFTVRTNNPGKAQAIVIRHLVETARKLFGSNMTVKADNSIWGGYYFNRANGDALVVR